MGRCLLNLGKIREQRSRFVVDLEQLRHTVILGTVEIHCRSHAKAPAFVVSERYQEETRHWAVVATVYFCRDHTGEESSTTPTRVHILSQSDRNSIGC